MRYVGLDVGNRWIGLASGEAEGLATPLHTLRRSTKAADVAAIGRICAQESAEALVVGLPRNMDDSLGGQARRTLAFVEALQELGLAVYLCDERLSSATAYEYVCASRGRPPRPGERIDHVAAAIILQDYLHSLQATNRVG